MIGFYDYTVILTYLSLLSAGAGILVALSGYGHPYFGCFFLLFCGLCDAFDGKVARTKKNRSSVSKNYGIEIDSLSDLLAFGALPACIGAALIRRSTDLGSAFAASPNAWQANAVNFVLHAVLVLYILAAMIRLAYYNVTEQERQTAEPGERKYYLGLPVTSSALIFPTVLLLQYILPADITMFYIAAILLTAFLFLLRFQIKKPGLRGILIMVAIGAAEFVLLMLWKVISRWL